MRELALNEIEAVSGGYLMAHADGGGIDPNEIVVIGRRPARHDVSDAFAALLADWQSDHADDFVNTYHCSPSGDPGYDIKDGADVSGLSAEMKVALVVIVTVFEQLALGRPTVTSGTDGQHSTGSLHYSGNAVDLRSNNIPADQRVLVRDAMRQALGPDYDVVLEDDHFHVEYQPKG
jgi:hypothetical protein